MPRRDSSQKTKWLQMRSCKRMSSRTPVLIEWPDEGHMRTLQGFTADVGRQGCLVVAPQDPPLNLRTRLTNQATNQTADATIVWKERSSNSDDWELGLELFNPPENFWSLEK
ncbi:MAG TPA: PilZ domain-containing protein [Candidatus Dormibacteraeota bacterium]|nr:PilZ domain-containing protein [Candidatus Dormibacteraeota bacterium]